MDIEKEIELLKEKLALLERIKELQDVIKESDSTYNMTMEAIKALSDIASQLSAGATSSISVSTKVE